MSASEHDHRSPFKGLLFDLRARIPHYLSDFEDVFNLKVLASIFFMFFTSIGPAITFASLLQKDTEGEIGAIEVMISSAISGIIFSLIGGQPLVILGVTGPVAILTAAIYRISKDWGLKFIPFYGWCQLWGFFMHVFLSVFNANSLVKWISRYSQDIFGCLIAIIYLYTGLNGIFTRFDGNFESAAFQLIISLSTAWLGLKLCGARSWKIGNNEIRELVADYGTTVALLLCSILPYLSNRMRQVSVETLDIPVKFETTDGRAWAADLTDIPLWGVFAAVLPGFIITVLFFFDHNMSSVMSQDPAFGLKKPSTYHWDFFVLGLCLLVTGILGIPPTNGLIPQSPLHSKSLAVYHSTYSESGVRVEVIGKVYEQRVSNLMQAVLIGVMCFPPFSSVIRLVPNSALDGLFLILGITSFDGNQLFERLSLIFIEPRLRQLQREEFKAISFKKLSRFSLLQALICLIIFGITLTPAAVVFPVLIGVLIPFRYYYLPSIVGRATVEALDPYEPVDAASLPSVSMEIEFVEASNAKEEEELLEEKCIDEVGDGEKDNATATEEVYVRVDTTESTGP